jgi:hypothetical protein
MTCRDAATRSSLNRWLDASLPTQPQDRPEVSRSAGAIRSWLILALATGLAGCQDRDIGTIRADRGTIEQLQRASSDRPAPASNTKKGRNRPETDDLSPKLLTPKSGAGEAQP